MEDNNKEDDNNKDDNDENDILAQGLYRDVGFSPERHGFQRHRP